MLTTTSTVSSSSMPGLIKQIIKKIIDAIKIQIHPSPPITLPLELKILKIILNEGCTKGLELKLHIKQSLATEANNKS